MKLHLGCGQRYLQGYVNIDFPTSEHSVQETSVADLHANILDLVYPPCSIDEIRLHHVFEHFPRPVACALLSGWSSWLRPGGTLHIEVPDFQKTALAILNPFNSFKKKAVAERHLFGSHEAIWAVHYEGYTPATLTHMLSCFSYSVCNIKKNSWKDTFNFEVFAVAGQNLWDRDDFETAATDYLSSHLLDNTEDKLLSLWMKHYRAQLDKTWARNA